MIPDEHLVEAIEQLMVEAIGVTAIVLAEAGPDVELTFAQWRAIAVVGAASDGIRVGELASRMRSTIPTTSRLVRRLENRGLVLAERDTVDRRATRVSLTDAGSTMRQTLVAMRKQRVRDAIAERPKAVSGQLVTGLQQVGEALRAYG